MSTFTRTGALLSLGLALLLAPPTGAAQTPDELAKLAGWHGRAPNSPDAFSFVVLGDRTGGHTPGEWEAAVAEVNLLRPDFVLCVGDLIEGYQTDEKVINEQWDELEDLTARLDAPFFFCPGNHDVIGRDRTWPTPARQVYLRRHGVDGRTYYSFDYRGSHFVVLDSLGMMTNAEFADAELTWLKADLAAAKDAQHLFVFYHHPLWVESPPTLWPRLRALLPAGKTTIFNGHWHNLSYHQEADVPTCVLASTGAGVDPKAPRLAGEYRLYARVTVDRGEPTVALVPLHELKPASYAAEVEAASHVLDDLGQAVAVPAAGGEATLKLTNPTAAPVTITATWVGENVGIEPATARKMVVGGGSGELTFQVPRPRGARPKLHLEAEFITGEKLARDLPLATWQSGEVGRLADVTIDGDLAEWRGVPALSLDRPEQVCVARKEWRGPKDSSCRFRAAIRGSDLVVAFEATDDALVNDQVYPWDNDAVELFWDVRPAATRDGKAGPGTGQLILAVPDADGPATKVFWGTAGKQGDPPAGLMHAIRRTAGGYTVEASLPLATLGLAQAPAPGETLYLELIQDDRDVRDGKAVWTAKSSSGTGNCHQYTGAYARLRCR